MKLCTNCNFENDDDTLYCSECGSAIKENVYCTECGGETDADEAFCMKCGAKMISEKEVSQTVPDKEQKMIPEKIKFDKNFLKGKRKWAVILVGIFALVLIFSIFKPIDLFSDKNIILYQKDYELNISSISKKEPMELTKKLWSGNDSASYSTLEFSGTHLSSDFKTLYYMDKSENNNASFYMMKMKSSNFEKNEAVKVDSDIFPNSTFMTEDGKSFIYITDPNKTLMIYNQEESIEIDDEVNDYTFNDENKCLYYFKVDGSIYFVSLNDIEDTNKITNSYTIQWMDKNANLYYVKDEKLYLSKLGNDSEKLASDINNLITVTSKGVYYTKAMKKDVKLSDYVVDKMKDSDANLVMPIEPNSDNFYEQVMVKTYYGNRMEDKFNNEKYNIAYDKYIEEMLVWNAKSDRDSLRAELKSSVMTSVNYELYFHDGTSDVLITDNFSEHVVRAYNINALVYNKFDISTIEKVDISEIDALSDVEEMVNSMKLKSDDLFVSMDGSEMVIKQSNYSNCYASKDSIFLLDNFDGDSRTGDLTKFTFDNNGSIVAEVIDDDVYKFEVDYELNSLIYFKDQDVNSGTLYLDGVEIASDVDMTQFYRVENSDKILYLVDYEDYGGTLTFYNNGKEIEIADDVSNFLYVNDKHIVFLEDYSSSDGTSDLMLFSGKEAVKIDKEVQYLITENNNNFYTKFSTHLN